MIWALAKEQLRTQRRYVAWTAALIAVTVAMAVYAAMFATALTTEDAQLRKALGGDAEWGTYLEITHGVPDPDHPAFTFDQLTAALAADSAAQPQALALGNGGGLKPTASANIAAQVDPLAPVLGAVNWDAILIDGRAPHQGEAVVSAAYAKEMGLEIGDLVPLVAQKWDSDGMNSQLVPVDFPLTITGISHSAVDAAGVSVWVPVGYMNAADLAAADAAFVSAMNSVRDPGEEAFEAFPITTYEVTWIGNAPAIVALSEDAPLPDPRGSAVSSSTVSIAVALVAVGALIVGVIAMAFAVGRSQAQLRSQWVATARALGASKERIIAATLAESAVIGVIGGAVGYALGAAITGIHLAFVRSSVPGAAFDATVSFDWQIAGGALVLALTLSLIIGAIPAFWSSRVTPAAALKPVTELTEAEVSRRVKVAPLVYTWLGASAVFAACVVIGAPGTLLLVPVFAGVVMLVTGIMVLQEALRWSIPLAGTRLARSTRRVVMVAGDALIARPRQATIPAFIMALATGAMTAIYLPILAGYVTEYDWPEDFGGVPVEKPPYAWMVLPTIGTVLLATLICVAISASTSTLTAREAATREALGMTRRDGRLSTALAYAVAQFHGLMWGLAAGIFAGSWAVPGARVPEEAAYEWLAHTAVGLAWMVLAAVVAIAVGALLAGGAAQTTRPVSRIEVSA